MLTTADAGSWGAGGPVRCFALPVQVAEQKSATGSGGISLLPAAQKSATWDCSVLWAQLTDLAPSAQMNVFGHLSDGNLHVNIILDPAEWPNATRITSAVHEKVVAEGSSISAEHGLGQYHLAEFRRMTPTPEQDFLQDLKSLLDPAERLNPGKGYRPTV